MTGQRAPLGEPPVERDRMEWQHGAGVLASMPLFRASRDALQLDRVPSVLQVHDQAVAVALADFERYGATTGCGCSGAGRIRTRKA